MNNYLPVKNGIKIPEEEIEITASRSGGAGGQHVNKTSTKITLRWNARASKAFQDEQKEIVLKNLEKQLTSDGDLIIHSSFSRSQHANKKAALDKLAQEIRKALFVPTQRRATKISKSVKESRLKAKSFRSSIKKLRSKKFLDE